LSYLQSDHVETAETHVVWFSAFTRGPLLGRLLRTEQRFNGYRLASSQPNFAFTLIRDDSGLTGDGSYYFGKGSDAYVERAVEELLSSLMSTAATGQTSRTFIFMGSSMGAYAAAKFGIRLGASSILCLVPHFDVRAAVAYCGRQPWIDWVISDLGPEARDRYLVRLQDYLDSSRTELPRLMILSAVDDVGVHKEQVLPFVEKYLEHDGAVNCDFRPSGGHSMVNASTEYILAALDLLQTNGAFTSGMFDGLPRRKEHWTERVERYAAKLERGVAQLLRLKS
jgi:hypothetical protein